ncbi:TRMT2A [Mytilus edulis]|uniref:tRNA (uracil(54)-C(5))-methyltransferase n=1 Tax=Mytilus edulis TaxID=6550 RepID=A0A8S3PMF8_MYTED|nr:TRMT2A [Mytilus edulis]
MSDDLRPDVFRQFLKVLKQEENICAQSHNPVQPNDFVPVSQFNIETMKFMHHFTPTTRRAIPTQYSSGHGINRFRLKLIEHYARVNGNDPSLFMRIETSKVRTTIYKKVDQVIGIELCEQAVEDAKQNAKLNGIYNCRYQCGKAEDLITRVMKSLHTKDVVAILDPPRAGIHPKVIHAIRKCPVLTKLIYVSCSPKSATNNFVDLMKNPSKKTKGMPYKPVKAIPVDLFPYTKHCEMVILFERQLPPPEADDSS